MRKMMTALVALAMTVVLSGCLFGKKEEAAAPAEAPAAEAPAEGAAPADASAAPAEGQPAHQ